MPVAVCTYVSRIEHRFCAALYFMCDWIVGHFHTTSHLTKLSLFDLLSVRTLCDAYYKDRASH